VNNQTYYGTSCTASCGIFDLELGTHNVPKNNLPSGLNWPQVLITPDGVNYPNGNPPVLKYTVSCADGTCANAEVAHKVDLHICLDTTC
jgi:hypothetical protein